MSDAIIAWDIGGAHLKAAHLFQSGSCLETAEWSTPLWKGLDSLRYAMAEAHEKFRITTSSRQVATTTAELVDYFPDRKEGLAKITDILSESGELIHLYAVDKRFLPLQNIAGNERYIASANWHATASFVAKRVSNGLLMDIGSSTTDIIPFGNGAIKSQSITDHQRLCAGELLYIGVIRTPVMAMVQQVNFAGKSVPIMAELFATAEDVYQLSGKIKINESEHDSADGKNKSLTSAARRLARMLALDLGLDTNIEAVKSMAMDIAEQQYKDIGKALDRQLKLLNQTSKLSLVGAGHGRFIIEALARDKGIEYLEIESLYDCEQAKPSSNCATAVALAYLAQELL